MINNLKKNKKEDSIRIIPLGGCREIGKNCTIFEYNNELIIIDFGVMFPDFDMHGIDLVIPDASYLFKNINKVKAVILTHGHEDHIGALPYLIRQINVPVYGTKFTLALVKNRLIEHGLLKEVDLHEVKYRELFKVGNFNIKFLKTTHSTAESAAILLETSIGKILHTGDFKIDHTPIDNEYFDFYSFADLGENGLLVLLSDSTNINKHGYTLSEKEIYQSLRDTFRRNKGRIFIATFASNVHRIQIMFDLAKEFNKKIAITGRSMESNIQIARELGYLKCSDDQFLSIQDLKDFPRHRTILITTGTQGEPMSALSLLANEKHRWLMIEEGDIVIISASVIPGNEKGVSRIINNLLRCGAQVIYEAFEDIHVSGHGYREELKMMLSLTKPKFFIPIHGEYCNLKSHGKLAKKMGIHENSIQIMENGDIIELSQKSIAKVGQIDLQQIFVDGKGVGDVGNKVIQDRHILSEDGIVVVIILLNKNKDGKFFFTTEIISRGFVYIKESTSMLDKAQDIVKKIMDTYQNENQNNSNSVKNKIISELRNYFYYKTKRRPIIIARIIQK